MTSRASASAPTFVSPFARLNDLLEGIAPGAAAINLTVGEPRHAVPAIVAPVLASAIADFGRYPPIKGTDAFRAAVAAWLDRRYGLDGAIDPATMILPLNGSREGLFYAAIEARMTCSKAVADPVVLLPNPFYQAYAAGCTAAGATPVMLPADSSTGFLPDLEAVAPELLDRAIACYFASPANPQGAVASLDAWRTLIRLARQHGFFLFADECYSEIYRLTPPSGVLEAAKSLGGFDHVLAFNSLSKRSNLPGLRCGFVAGDPAFIRRWTGFRNMAAPQVPLPIQAVAAAVLGDEAHVEDNRRLYNAKFEAAERMLSPLFGNITPPGGFFLWLDVARFGGGEAVTLKLWREAGVRVVPGGYLAATDDTGHNPGDAYIRLALVDGLDATTEAFARLVGTLA
ncbi:MAG: aminotransferase class I/II-fold pyridoxal phosphate-dependent enzyme [Ancalomicrobiaceae bacterium]|nr:aminotransferase class I/II-fold pyridoxal phosphate-dependent enzyme [Ancalomicrobiaceae bacterium]